MIEPSFETQSASDGYALHTTRWRPEGPPRGRVVILHGVQSHGGWYHNLGRVLAGRSYEAIFPDRRGSGRNEADRGHARSSGRLLADVAELLQTLRNDNPSLPIALAGISWGGKLATIAAARRPDLVDSLALICPGLHPQVDVTPEERLRIALAFFTNRRRRFPIPLADPALFTDNPEAQAFIASDPLSLRTATAALLAASRFIDRGVRASRGKVRQPALLMLAGHDRIVDNARTRSYFAGIGSAYPRVIDYPDGHHTLEFDPDSSRYALDLADWLDEALPSAVRTSRP
jgi:alpha-beta hydrolase superfamily lysophospholipase